MAKKKKNKTKKTAPKQNKQNKKKSKAQKKRDQRAAKKKKDKQTAKAKKEALRNRPMTKGVAPTADELALNRLKGTLTDLAEFEPQYFADFAGDRASEILRKIEPAEHTEEEKKKLLANINKNLAKIEEKLLQADANKYNYAACNSAFDAIDMWLFEGTAYQTDEFDDTEFYEVGNENEVPF